MDSSKKLGMGIEPTYNSSAGCRLNRSATPARWLYYLTEIKILLAIPSSKMYSNLRLTDFQTLSLANNFRNEANKNYLFEHSFVNQILQQITILLVFVCRNKTRRSIHSAYILVVLGRNFFFSDVPRLEFNANGECWKARMKNSEWSVLFFLADCFVPEEQFIVTRRYCVNIGGVVIDYV